MPRSPWEASTVQCCLPPTVTRVMLPKQGRAAACLACPKCPWLANFVLRLVFKSNITSWVHRTDAERARHTHALRTRRARSRASGVLGAQSSEPGRCPDRRAAAGDCAAAPHCAQSVRRAAYGTATTRSRADAPTGHSRYCTNMSLASSSAATCRAYMLHLLGPHPFEIINERQLTQTHPQHAPSHS